MYGYVRPDKNELKVSEYRRFQGVYCGLCHTLRRRYGPVSRFLVNYDFTFLAMLLSENEAVFCQKHCPTHPFRKRPCLAAGKGLDTAADYTVVLAWWKLKDQIRDEAFFGRLSCRVACLLLRRAYKRAAASCSAFDKAVRENLSALAALEDSHCPSIDETADKFARILSATGSGASDPAHRRILEELLYHIGRIVYILDAADDLPEDEKTGGYNPLRYRFSLQGGKLSPEDEASLRSTLQHSHNSVCSAFVLLGPGPYQSILSNIIYLGLPAVTQAVFAGKWKARDKETKERSIL